MRFSNANQCMGGLVATAVLGCGDTATTGTDAQQSCIAFPVEGESVDGFLTNEDTCLRWLIGEGESVTLQIALDETDSECDETFDDAVALGSDPVADQADNGVVWQFVVLGAWPGEGSVTVQCDDGTRWEGMFDVAETSDSGVG